MTKTQPEQTTTVLEHSLHKFVAEIVDLVQDGWQVDEENCAAMVGFTYEANLWRNPTEAQRLAGPKLSRAEILAKAREAKALKRSQAEPAGEESEPTDDSPY